MNQVGGFTTVGLRSGWAVDALFGVGAQSGGEATVSCPLNTMITGIAGGSVPRKFTWAQKGRLWLANLQFQCR